jgi:hypothetical protein
MTSLINYCIPDPNRPVSFESFVEQYIEQIKALDPDMSQYDLRKASPDVIFRAQAEMLAEADIETLQIVMASEPEKTAEECLRMMVPPIANNSTEVF